VAFTMRGQAGELRRGYQVAARLGSWTWDGGGRVEARPSLVNDFWLDESEPPLSLHLEVASQTWVWSGVELADNGQPMVIAVTGKPERR
jgi:hypothetical protein